MMRLNIAWSVCLLGCILLVLSGCGRDDLARSCTADSDCKGERVCTAGSCLDPDDVDEDANNSDVAGSCSSDQDCMNAGVCEVVNGECVANRCTGSGGDQAGFCETAPCDLGCAEFEEPSGCSCVAKSCAHSDECGAYACIDGQCGPCASDRDCPAREQCQDDRCVDRPECLLDRDCDDQELCLNGQCTWAPDCESDTDCDEGFECVGGQCHEAICRGPQDCSNGQVCDGGSCVEPPQAESCFVAHKRVIVTEHQQVRLEAFAVDADGNGVPADFQWRSSDASVATIADDGRYAIGAGGTGVATITARLGESGVVCDGNVVLTDPGDVADGDLRVIVSHAETGAGVSGATVVLGDGTQASTDLNGVATLSDPGGSFDVSVFAGEFNYVTIQQVQSIDLRIPLSPQEGTGPVAGFSGEFDLDHINTSGDVTLGLAGASISGGLLDMNLERLLGNPFMTRVEVPGMGGSDIPLPAGLVLFGQVFGLDLDIKQTYYASTSGGARMSWGLAGKVPAQRLIRLFQNGSDGTGDVLTSLLPLFNRFDHASRPLNLVAQSRVADTGDLDGDGDTTEMVPDYDSFPEVSLAPSVRQNLVSDVDVSNFPQLSDGTAEVAVLVGGVLLDAPGYIPLGISATNDEDGDGRPDTRRLSMAPPHGSLTGGRLAVVALSFVPEDVGFEDGVEMPDEFSASLWSGQSMPTSIQLGTFADASSGTVDAGARTVSVTADAGPLFRVRMVGQDRTWDVWSAGPGGVQGVFSHVVEVPAVPAGRDDLFSGSEVFVDAIATQVGLDDLVRATGIGLGDTGIVTTGFNRTKLR